MQRIQLKAFLQIYSGAESGKAVEMSAEPDHLAGISYSLKLLSRFLSRKVPARVQQSIISGILNRSLSEELKNGDFDFLSGRTARIEVTDLELVFSLSCCRQRLRVQMPDQPAEVSFRSDVQSILDIIHRTADPDTLFFRRKLLITGDTELGLELKNLLDRIEPTERLPAPLLSFLRRIHRAQDM